MSRTSVPVALAILGALGVLAGAAALERVFISERRDAVEALEGQRAALAGYAGVDLEERYRTALDRRRDRLEAALEDVLVDARDLLYLRDGRQVLPRRFRFADGAPRAETLHRRLKSNELDEADLEGDEPWPRRLRRLAALRAGLDSGSRPAIEDAFRGILTERARFVIDSRDDLTFTLVTLELLDEASSPDPSLMTMMLRDGLSDTRGNRLPGLQRQLLERRDKLTKPDFDFLTERIADLSERSAVRHDDFLERAAEPSAEAIELPGDIAQPVLLGGGAWYAEPHETSSLVTGAALGLAEMLDATRDAMLERGLIEPPDAIAVEPFAASAQPLSELKLSVASPRWEESRAAIERRFRLKTGLAVLLASLVAAAFVTAAAWTRRERQLLELKSGFVATVSHELRTPLASMRLMAETLERRLDGVAGVRDYPRRLVREIDSLNFLVENILGFNRLEKGKWAPRPEAIAVADLVHTLETELPGTTKKKVRIHFDGGSELAVKVDPELARLLFLNLGTNACKYNDAEVVEIRVEAEAEAGSPTVIRVADNGVGIPEGEREDVFREFHRAQSGGRGFGLGLAICRRIMALHEGAIRVADSSTKGTVFELSFP